MHVCIRLFFSQEAHNENVQNLDFDLKLYI